MADVAINTATQSSAPTHVGGFTDYVIPQLLAWRKSRLPSALVTLVGIDGSSPRPLGSQMAIAADGRYVGQISSGCAELAIVEQARMLIDDGRDDCFRYGKGSSFVDVVLPCGSGIDILFSPNVKNHTLEGIAASMKARKPVDLQIDLTTYEHTAEFPTHKNDDTQRLATASHVTSTNLTKHFCPKTRVLVFGRGPMVGAFTQFATALEFETHVFAPDTVTLSDPLSANATVVTQLTTPHTLPSLPTDPWTAAILMFHDHDWEPKILEALINTPCFYLGALGSRQTHYTRLDFLRDQGCDERALAHINGPAGIDIAAQTPPEIAMSIIAEILQRVRTNPAPSINPTK